MAKALRTSPRGFFTRIHVVTVCILVAGLIIVGRLSILQIKEHETWLAKAASQQQVLLKEEVERGEILWMGKDRLLQPAASNTHFPYVWAAPKEIENFERAAKALTPLLGIAEDALLKRLAKPGDPYELLAKRVPAEIVNRIQELGLKGVYVSEEKQRFYPAETLASHVIGFVAEDESGKIAGRYGAEAFYDDTLQGKNNARRQASRIRVGSKLVLTLDPNIQFEAERLLKASVQKWHAKSATVIVMESHTGRILAMANQPTFNPNEFNKEENLEHFINRAVSFRYEPGSVFKPFVVAAGLESGAITKDTTYFDSGEVEIDGYTIKNAGNSRPNKLITMTRFLEHSYNLGAVFVATRVGPDYMRKFLVDILGFEEKSGIDLPNEVKNDFSNLEPPEGKRINFATAAFGQGIALTPLKLLQAFNVFANGGYLLRPYVVERVISPDGKETITEPKRLRQIVSRRTLDDLIPMLESVVSGEQGSGRLARIKGYHIAGKTGTGEIPFEHGRGYYETRVNHTFVGFGPTSNSKVTILVRIEEPIGVRYAETTAVPVFHDLMKFILNYYGIPPDKPEELGS